jgi:hypothetical protein
MDSTVTAKMINNRARTLLFICSPYQSYWLHATALALRALDRAQPIHGRDVLLLRFGSLQRSYGVAGKLDFDVFRDAELNPVVLESYYRTVNPA